MNLLYNNEIFIENIFKIRNDIFKKLNISANEDLLQTQSQLDDNDIIHSRKVKFDTNCEVILIPSRQEYIDQNLKNIVWYSVNDLQNMRTSYLFEMNVISNMRNITMNDAIKLWKYENNMII